MKGIVFQGRMIGSDASDFVEHVIAKGYKRLFIDSEGGYAEDFPWLIKALYSVSNLECIGVNGIASLGALMFLCGKKRCLLEGTSVYFHRPSIKLNSGKINADGALMLSMQEDLLGNKLDAAKYLKMSEELIIWERQGIDLIARQTRLSRSSAKKLMFNPRFLSPEEALDMGITHNIISHEHLI